MTDATVCMPDFTEYSPANLYRWLLTQCIVAEIVQRDYGVVLWLEFIDFYGLYQAVETDTMSREVLADACDMVYILQHSGDHEI